MNWKVPSFRALDSQGVLTAAPVPASFLSCRQRHLSNHVHRLTDLLPRSITVRVGSSTAAAIIIRHRLFTQYPAVISAKNLHFTIHCLATKQLVHIKPMICW